MLLHLPVVTPCWWGSHPPAPAGLWVRAASRAINPLALSACHMGGESILWWQEACQQQTQVLAARRLGVKEGGAATLFATPGHWLF